MKTFRRIAFLLTLCLSVSILGACNDTDTGLDYDDSSQYGGEEQPTDYGSYTDEDVTEPSEAANTFSLDGTPINEDFASEVYTAMQSHSYEEYKFISTGQWKGLGEEERRQIYEAFSGILTDLSFPVNVQYEAWAAAMDEDADWYTDYLIWGFAFTRLGLDRAEPLAALYSYAKGVEEGKYAPLHPEIMAAADDITVEYYVGQYLLCVGGNHNIAQLTKAWTAEESGFYQSGSVTPVATADLFDSVSVSYSFGGANSAFDQAEFGGTDLLPVLKATGAVAQDGAMLCDQIQISAKSVFDAPALFVLAQDDDDLITFAAVKYSEDEGKYKWDGETLTTAERCCFDKDGNFCYIDGSGVLQAIPA